MFDVIAVIGFLACIVCIVMAVLSLIKKNGKAKKFGIGVLVTFILFAIGASNNPKTENKTVANTKQASSVNSKKEIKEETKENTQKETKEEKKEEKNTPTGNLKVHYINVGQADSILIQQGSHNMLIDAGNNADSNLVKNYLVQQGVNNLEFLIGTHPHEDHIGGMDYIINSLKVGKIYMPKATSTTKTFKDVVAAAQNKGLKLTVPTPGNSFKLGEATCTVLAPNGSSYKDLNNHSIVIKVQFGENSFMFDGDAEAISEMEMVNKGIDLKTDVLKVGHHGSNSSTCANFLKAVNPKYAVICVGDGNKYGHPHKSTMDRLKEKGVQVYRTDENGTIVATSDGKNITFNTKPGSYNFRSSGEKTSSSTSNKQTTSPKVVSKPNANNSSQSSTMVWLPASRGKYHAIPNCGRMNPNKATKVTLQEAKDMGYEPCSKCHPPR